MPPAHDRLRRHVQIVWLSPGFEECRVTAAPAVVAGPPIGGSVLFYNGFY